MHQHSRPPPVTASPASSPKTNPTRTNNPRGQESGGSRASSGRGTPSEQGSSMGQGSDALIRGVETSSQGKSSTEKLSQVVSVR